jgi:hypothetical protein
MVRQGGMVERRDFCLVAREIVAPDAPYDKSAQFVSTSKPKVNWRNQALTTTANLFSEKSKFFGSVSALGAQCLP